MGIKHWFRINRNSVVEVNFVKWRKPPNLLLFYLIFYFSGWIWVKLWVFVQFITLNEAWKFISYRFWVFGNIQRLPVVNKLVFLSTSPSKEVKQMKKRTFQLLIVFIIFRDAKNKRAEKIDLVPNLSWTKYLLVFSTKVFFSLIIKTWFYSRHCYTFLSRIEKYSPHFCTWHSEVRLFTSVTD